MKRERERRTISLRIVCLVNESRNDVSSLDTVIIMRPIDICGNDGGEVAPILFCIAFVHDINHSLGISISTITIMWGTIVHHLLVDRVGGLIGEDTCR